MTEIYEILRIFMGCANILNRRFVPIGHTFAYGREQTKFLMRTILIFIGLSLTIGACSKQGGEQTYDSTAVSNSSSRSSSSSQYTAPAGTGATTPSQPTAPSDTAKKGDTTHRY